jgi:hypothetical protein
MSDTRRVNAASDYVVIDSGEGGGPLAANLDAKK